jgi:hypothetical protein
MALGGKKSFAAKIFPAKSFKAFCWAAARYSSHPTGRQTNPLKSNIHIFLTARKDERPDAVFLSQRPSVSQVRIFRPASS